MIKRMGKISKLKRKVDEQAYEMEELSRELTEATTQLTTLQAVPPSHQHTYLPNASLDSSKQLSSIQQLIYP